MATSLSAPRDEPIIAATPKRDAPLRMTDTDIASQVQRLREEAYERDYAIHRKWQDCYAAYRNQENFDDKAPWQSKLAFTKGYSAVKQFVANIFKLLLSSEQWVTVEPGEPNPMQKVTAPMVEGVVLKLADNDSIRVELRDALEFGAIIGVVALRVEWEYSNRSELGSDFPRDGSTIPSNIGSQQGLAVRQRKEGHLNVTSVDPFHLWWGPRTRGRRDIDWIIEESFGDLASLKAAGGFKNLDKISSDTPDPVTITQSYEQQRKDRRMAPETIRKQIHLIEFWGDLVDPKTNETIFPNRHVIIANKTTVIKDEPNPYWDGKPPYILASPLIVAGRWPGQGVLEMSLSLLKEVNEVARKMSDHLSYSVVPMLEIEAQALENPEGDAQTGIQPGKVWYRRSGAGMQAVMGVQMPQLSNASFNFELALDKEVQRGTFITEAVQGLIDAKGETTATEVQATIQQATSLIADIATSLDDAMLTPLAEAIWSRAFQFIDGRAANDVARFMQRYLGILDHVRLLVLQLFGAFQHCHNIDVLERQVEA